MLGSQLKSLSLVIADDDPDFRLLIREALVDAGYIGNIHEVEDGQALLDFLLRTDSEVPETRVRPMLILCDLHMPRKGGFDVISEVRAHPDLKAIPVVLMTTSEAEEDIYQSYALGVNSFITKPVSYPDLVEKLKTLENYWFKTVELPVQYNGEA